MAEKPIYQDDLKFLQASIPELQSYILSREIFWPVYYGNFQTAAGMSKLTIGNIYLAIERLKAFDDLPPAVFIQVSSAINEFETFKSKWKTNLKNKGIEELSARINLWMNYLNEIDKKSHFNKAEYANNVRWRAIVQLLLDNDVPLDEKARNHLNSCDTLLRREFCETHFVWDTAYQNHFDQVKFWYLYLELA